jgi:hypothetical protein
MAGLAPPKMRTQLVAARTVAEALADLATGPETTPAPGPNGKPIPEIACPRKESLVEMARLLAVHRVDPMRIEGVSTRTTRTKTCTRRVPCSPARTPPRRPDLRGVAKSGDLVRTRVCADGNRKWLTFAAVDRPGQGCFGQGTQASVRLPSGPPARRS